MKIQKNIPIIAMLTFIPFIFASCGEQKKNESKADTAASTAKPYPLDVCLVSGEELGSMGAPHVFVYQGQEIKMCCDKCVPKFNKTPEKYLAQLKQGKSRNDSKHQTDHSGHNH